MKRRSFNIILLILACTSVQVAADRGVNPYAVADTVDPSSWLLRIEAMAAGVHDSLALMGVRPDATPDYDPQYEVPRPPPPPGSYVMVYFPHDTGNWPIILGTKYAVDYTSPVSPSWRFMVETNVGAGPVTLEWDTSLINRLPESYAIIVTDSTADSVFPMRKRDSYTFPYSSPRTFLVRVELASSFIPIIQGWNIVSVPRLLDDNTASTLFPAKTSAAYAFDDAYMQRETLVVGRGYWMKFPGPGLSVMTGFSLDAADIPVKEGWNLIGSISNTVAVPVSPIITSPFYEYSGGYHRVDSILPGRGYWIKVDQDGFLPLGPATLTPSAVDRLGEEVPGETRGTIEVTDGRDGRATLALFSSADPGDMDYFTLPPVPPADCFDARFRDERMAAFPDPSSGNEEIAIVVQSGGGTLRFRGLPEHPIEEYLLKTGPDQWKAISGTSEPVAITCGPGRHIFLLRVTSGPAHPGRFTLAQNYPNPFNPSTTISYTLPADARVSVAVRDIAGRTVFRSDNRTESAGIHHVRFDAHSLELASGVYLFSVSGATLEGGATFGSSGKMIYLR
jgi:hypothetical protein